MYRANCLLPWMDDNVWNDRNFLQRKDNTYFKRLLYASRSCIPSCREGTYGGGGAKEVGYSWIQTETQLV